MNQLILSPIPIDDLVNLISKAVTNQTHLNNEKAVETQPEKEEYLTRHEVSKLFHISLVTLNKHTKNNRLQAHRIGARVLYKRSEVMNALSTIK